MTDDKRTLHPVTAAEIEETLSFALRYAARSGCTPHASPHFALMMETVRGPATVRVGLPAGRVVTSG